MVITSRIIKDPYPDYEGVIPKDNNKTLVINNEKFSEAIKRVSIFSNKSSRQISLELSENNITISTEDPENVTTENKVKIYKLLNGQVSKESNDAEVEGSTGQSVKEMSKNVSAGAVEGKAPAAKTNFEKEQEDWIASVMQFSK